LTATGASTPNFTGPLFDLSTVYKGSQVTTLTPEQRSQFSNPGPGEVGDLPRYSLRGPAYANLDASMFTNPAVNINSGNFGVISASLPARIGQLALKIVF
jgi:hypothetical protein